MSLTTLTSKELSQVQTLIARKEALAQQIIEINRDLQAIESGTPKSVRGSSPSTGTAATLKSFKSAPSILLRKKTRTGKTVRGALKERVTSELKSAGSQGMKVKELATLLGTSYGNVTAFFQSTGKKIKEIKKVGPGRFAWTGA